MTGPIPPPSQPSLFQKMRDGFYLGAQVTLCQLPFRLPFTCISTTAAYENLGPIAAARHIYRGSPYNTITPGVRHFYRGWTGFVTKEISRLGFKTFGLLKKPSIDGYFKDEPYGKWKAYAVFAGALSIAEMAINPTDTLRTLWQAGRKFDVIKGNVLSHMYKGSWANGFKAFGIWGLFAHSEGVWSNAMKKYSSIDPHDLPGIAIKSVAQAFHIMLPPVWLLERLKNELQYRPELKSLEGKTSRYRAAFDYILRTQGWRGLGRGYLPKVADMWILAFGSNYVLERGRRKQTN